MEALSLKQKNQTVNIFTHTGNFPDLSVYKLTDTLTPVVSSWHIEEIKPTYYKTSILTPNENCYLCINFGENPIVIRVGEPQLKFIFYSPSIDEQFSYTQFLGDGFQVDTGTLVSTSANFHYTDLSVKESSIIEINNGLGFKEPFKLNLPYGGFAKVCSITSGTIEIESNAWQLVAIPIEFGYWENGGFIHDTDVRANVYNYVIKQIEEIYNQPANQLIEVMNTYIGDNRFFYSYVPGFTNPNSDHNFKFIYNDNGMKEIVGFWVKSISSQDIHINWGCE